MRTPTFLHPLLGRQPKLEHVVHAVGMGAGSYEEVARMVIGLRQLLPVAKIHMVAQAGCANLDIDDWIGTATVQQAPFSFLRGLGRIKPDLVAILVNGKWAFWKQWLFGSLLRARHCLVFDEFGNSFALRPRNIPQLIQTLFPSNRKGGMPNLHSRLRRVLGRIARLPLRSCEWLGLKTSWRTPVCLHPLLFRSPNSNLIHSAVGIAAGNPGEVERMVAGLRKILPLAKIHMVAQPECKHLEVDEWIDIRTVNKAPIAAFRSLGRTKPDLIVILVNGRRAFWRQWLFGFMLRARYGLVFNKNGDAFYLRLQDLPHLIYTLFRLERIGHKRSAASKFIELLSRIAGLPVLFIQAMAMEWSKRKPDPAFALAIPGEFVWHATQERGVYLQMESAKDANSTGEQQPNASSLGFTGERFVPGIDLDLELEHYSRYSFASHFVAGRRVLDAGCGEGYGIASLARVAKEAVGIDVSGEAIESARDRYRRSNLEFVHVEASKSYPFHDKYFDLVTSFEVIEHIPDWSDYLQRIDRVLSDTGMLILSSPNRPYYRDERGEINPFHYHEFDLEELDQLLATHFPHRKMLGQNHYGGVLIEDYQTDLVRVDSTGGLNGRELGNAHYFLAVCSRSPLPQIEGLCYPSIRGNQMRDRERHIAFLKEELLKARIAYERLASEFEERGLWALSMQKDLETLRAHQDGDSPG